MNTPTQSNAGLARLGKSIANAAVVMLSSIDRNGARRTRPMTPLEMDGDGRLWFFTDLRAETAEPVRVANVSFTDPASGTYVSLSGRSEIDTDSARIERLWRVFGRTVRTHAKAAKSSHVALLKFVPDPIGAWDPPLRE